MKEKMRVHYKDPISYSEILICDSLTCDHDAVITEKNHSTYPKEFRGSQFHFYKSEAICKKINIELPKHTQKKFILVRSNVFLCGYRCYVGENGYYNLDETLVEQDSIGYLDKLTGEMQFENELTGFQFDSGDLYLNFNNREIIKINEPIISMTSDEAPNYGSFLIKILPKLIDIAKFNHNIKILVPMYFDGAIEYLRLCGIDESRIIKQDVTKIYHLKKVIIPCIRNKDFWIDSESRQFYNSIKLRYGKSNAVERKIYISRRNFHSSGMAFHNRVLTNEDQLLNLLLEKKYEVHYPEKMPIHKQIQLFSSSSHIIGPSGSGLFNVIFCHSGTKLIDIESEPHWVQNHVRLFESLDLNYGVFEGDPVDRTFKNHHVPFEVDVDSLNTYL